MRQTVATLALLACAAAPAAAASITDQDLVISIGGVLQLRAEHNQAIQEGDTYNSFTGAQTASAADSHYDTNTGAVGKADAMDFYARRLRLIFKATYQDVWRLNVTLNGDRADQPRGAATAGNTTTNTSASTRNVGVYQAFLARDFKDGSIIHTLQGGLDTAFFNRAGDLGPNTQTLLLNQRATTQLLNPRGFGVAYRLTSPLVRFGIDIQNNLGDDGTDNALANDGMLYSGRVELTGPDDWAIPKWQEDFVGKPGHGWSLGLEAGYNHHDQLAALAENTYATDFDGTGTATTFTTGAAGAGQTAASTITQGTLVYGADLLFHYDNLNALAEVRFARTAGEVAIGPTRFTGSYNSLIWLVQAGYCFPAPADTVLEPALRFTHIDINTRNHSETAPFGTNDFGVSGQQYEVGLNWFINGHANKLCLALTLWQAEHGDSDATIVRLQHQFTF